MRELLNSPPRGPVLRVCAGLSACVLATSVCAQHSPFATRVMAFVPAPGQFVQSAMFNDPAAALGPPATGGLSAANNSKVVSLGGFGGTITLGFDHAIVNQPATGPDGANPAGVDFVVYGNPFFVATNPSRRFAEAGVIEVSADANGNGLADDAWFVIRGSHLPGGAGIGVAGGVPAGALVSVTYDDDASDGTHGPANATWIPPERSGSGSWTVSAFLLPSAFNGPIVNNPLGSASTSEGFCGYADCTPGLLLGDLDADGAIDDETVTAESFFTRPDDPFVVGVSPGSGGGDAIDISWAVDASTGLAANLQSIDFVRITTAVNFAHPVFGENSTELSGIAEVRVGAGTTDFNGDGVTDPDDLADFIGGFFSVPPDTRTDFNADGVIDPDDLADFIGAFFS